jgi:DNA-binding LytR/AlgR family response regulator
MRILIVEDEAVAARGLERLLRQELAEKIESLKIQSTLTAAECFIEDQQIDLLFLDLNLDGEDGFHLLQSAAAACFQTIIISAHTHRSLEAFEYGVLDFLAKPISKERLQRSLKRFLERDFSTARQLAVRSDETIEIISVEQISYVEAQNNYVLIKTDDGRTLRHRKTMEALAQLLPPSFLRIHRRYLVDRGRVKQVQVSPGSMYRARLNDGSIIPVSRQVYAREFRQNQR